MTPKEEALACLRRIMEEFSFENMCNTPAGRALIEEMRNRPAPDSATLLRRFQQMKYPNFDEDIP